MVTTPRAASGASSGEGQQGPGRPRASTPRAIQEAAVGLFLERGYGAVNVEDIAAAMGIGRTTIFRYFGSKSGIIWRDMEENAKRLAASLDASPKSLPVMEAVRQALLPEVDPDEEERAFVRGRLELISATAELEPDRAAAAARVANTIAAFLRERGNFAANPAIPEALGYAIAATLSTVSRRWAQSPMGTSYSEMLAAALDSIIAPFGSALEEAGV